MLGSSISADCTATVDGFNTVVCDDSNGVSSGKWFYEIEVLSATLVNPQFGWADADFEVIFGAESSRCGLVAWWSGGLVAWWSGRLVAVLDFQLLAF